MAAVNVGDVVSLRGRSDFVWQITALLADNIAECEWVPNPRIIQRYSTYDLVSRREPSSARRQKRQAKAKT